MNINVLIKDAPASESNVNVANVAVQPTDASLDVHSTYDDVHSSYSEGLLSLMSSHNEDDVAGLSILPTMSSSDAELESAVLGILPNDDQKYQTLEADDILGSAILNSQLVDSDRKEAPVASGIVILLFSIQKHYFRALLFLNI